MLINEAELYTALEEGAVGSYGGSNRDADQTVQLKE